MLSRTDGLADAPALALVFPDLRAHGYDLGLAFFALNSLNMGLLVWRSGVFATAFGAGFAIAGAIYLTASGPRLLAPEWSPVFAPACGLTILAEATFCLRLLLQRRPGAVGR